VNALRCGVNRQCSTERDPVTNIQIPFAEAFAFSIHVAMIVLIGEFTGENLGQLDVIGLQVSQFTGETRIFLVAG
jgi:hypothetical protein